MYFQILGKSYKSILLWKRFFARLGGRGFTQECFSNFSNNRFFQAEKLPEIPNVFNKEEYYR